MSKVFFQVKTPIRGSAQGSEHYLVAGEFDSDDVNSYAQTPFGPIIIPKVDVGPFVMFLADDFDLEAFANDRPDVLVVNYGP